MRILVTNDDGISAPGLKVAEDIAAELAGPDGEVWVVAPAFEQSGVGHCVSYIAPMRIERLGPRRAAIDGSPADCVIAAIHDVMDGRPDLVLSGVNRGHNVAQDTLYSGTVGGAMEGALQDLRAVAMSQYFGPRLEGDAAFAAARAHGADVVRRIIGAEIWEDHSYGVFFNVNFPPIPGEDVKGIRATKQGRRKGPTFGGKVQTAPNRRTYLWLTHGFGNDTAEHGTDAREAMEGHITVTPLRADLTAQDLVEPLARLL